VVRRRDILCPCVTYSCLRLVECCAQLRRLLPQIYTFFVDRENSCVASESCRIFPRDQSVHLRTQQLGSAEKSGLRDGKRADFIRNWRRCGIKYPDKPKLFIKKNVRNHSYHQFYPVLAKIRIT